MPLFAVHTLSKTLGRLLFLSGGGRRERLEREYTLSLSDLLGKQRKASSVRDAFWILAADELELLLYPTLNPKRTEHLVRSEGWEHLDRGLADGKGVLLLFAHFGSNRMVMPAVGYKGYTMTQLSAPPTVWIEKMPERLKSPMSRKALELRWQHEQSLPVTHANIFKSLKRAFDCLKRNEVLGIAMDGAGGKRRSEVQFLGKRANFSSGALEIALQTGCSVLPTFIVRTPSGIHEMVIEPPLSLDGSPSDTNRVQRGTQAFAHMLEQRVLAHPGHYLDFMALRRLTAEQGEDDPLFIE